MNSELKNAINELKSDIKNQNKLLEEQIQLLKLQNDQLIGLNRLILASNSMVPITKKNRRSLTAYGLAKADVKVLNVDFNDRFNEIMKLFDTEQEEIDKQEEENKQTKENKESKDKENNKKK